MATISPRSAMDEVLRAQDGVVTRHQLLSLGMGPHDLKRLLRRRELVAVHAGVYVTHTGAPNWLERAWAAVLAAGPDAALAGESALRAVAGPGSTWASDQIEVVVPHGRKVPSAMAGVHGVSDRRYGEITQPHLHPPRERLESAALRVANRAADDLDALGIITDVVGARRTTAQRLRAALDARDRWPRGRWLRDVLDDVEQGACSVLEVGYVRNIERAHGLPTAERQARADSTMGIIYRDIDLGSLVIELDGRLWHSSATARDKDLDRDLDLAVAQRQGVRLGFGQVYGRACATTTRIVQLLRLHGWRDEPKPCGPGCLVAQPGAA